MSTQVSYLVSSFLGRIDVELHLLGFHLSKVAMNELFYRGLLGSQIFVRENEDFNDGSMYDLLYSGPQGIADELGKKLETRRLDSKLYYFKEK